MFFFLTRSQEGVRIHTISRETGKVRLWELPTAFFVHGSGNAHDTDGPSMIWMIVALWERLKRTSISPL